VEEKKPARTKRLAEDLARKSLEEHDLFDIIFEEKVHLHGCELVEWGQSALVVRSGNSKYLVPWHAVKYVMLQENQEPEILNMPALFLQPKRPRRRPKDESEN
jgi:hypothetical protein